MENLIFSLNATIPIFLMMVLGVFFRKTGLLKENMINGLNQFVFKATLPVLLFGDLAKQDFAQAWNGKFVAFCFVVTLVSISLVALMSMALKDKSQRGEFIQGAYRSSAAILGIAFITNIYGNSGMAPLMIIGKRAALQRNGGDCPFLYKPGTEWHEPGTDQKNIKGDYHESDHSRHSVRRSVVSSPASHADHPF